MITLVGSGIFQLQETRTGGKLLKLNHRTYAWIMRPPVGSLLVYATNPQTTNASLSEGTFNMYRVTNEPQLTDSLHLEIKVSDGIWQAYLLLTGLPGRVNTKKRIIPTHEVISTSTTPQNEYNGQS